jgi:NAD(P)-dependent dehydrogenase (short-subunit alcohol dehydrogenase family)
VVADIDSQGAGQVAAEIEAAGHRALAVTADLAVAADAEGLVSRARQEFGRVDLLCSNAGIFASGGIEFPDDAWSTMWAVNVQSHIFLTRAVLPAMLSQGDGYLVYTASAAGLLTQLGSAPYAVTKHALVALAEWLSITYGDRGITVSCLCPQAVRTNLLATSQRQVNPGQDERHDAQEAVDGVLAPEDVAASVLEGIGGGRFLILPHPEVADYERRRAGDRDRWLGGMRRLRGRLGESTGR